MIAIVIDVESNGLPKNYKLDFRSVDNWPRVSQISWQVVNVETKFVLCEFDSIVFPDCWTIPTKEELIESKSKDPMFFENNNISTERCMAEGMPLPIILKLLCGQVNLLRPDVMVFHNLNFDFNTIAAEMLRYNISMDVKVPKICTMMTTISLLNLPGRYGAKFPKLEELHRFLFDKDFEGAHDSLFDVKATAACFIELVIRGHYDDFINELQKGELK